MKHNTTPADHDASASLPTALLPSTLLPAFLLPSPLLLASSSKPTPTLLTDRDFWPFDGRFNHWDEVPADDHEFQ